MSNHQPPVITQHSAIFKHLAHAGGLPLLYGVTVMYAITRRKRGPRMRALIAWNDMVLLVRNVADHDRWTLPGGGPKSGERYVEAIARELDEELAIRQPTAKFQFLKCYDKTEVGEPYDKICYFLDLSETQLSKITLSNEILEARWFSIHQPPQRLSSVVELAIRTTSQDSFYHSP